MPVSVQLVRDYSAQIVSRLSHRSMRLLHVRWNIIHVVDIALLPLHWDRRSMYPQRCCPHQKDVSVPVSPSEGTISEDATLPASGDALRHDPKSTRRYPGDAEILSSSGDRIRIT